MGMPTVKSYPLVPPGTAITADMQPTINAIGLLPQASLVQVILDAMPKASTKGRQVVVDLTAGLADVAVALGTLTTVQSITVRDLTGAQVPTLKLGAAAESPITLAKGDVIDGLSVTQLLLNCPAGGGSLTLVLLGR
ncbi:MAG TPA: hypothetical protein VJ549_00540 [Geothrix sp.]|nr:hypothetical protein [Geothrix sp.]HJV47735.1 hypothetical protein [Geothrix sp.]